MTRLLVALALALLLTSCATSGGPLLSSHGVDYAPSFNPNEGDAG
jgi:hypothetical protein